MDYYIQNTSIMRIVQQMCNAHRHFPLDTQIHCKHTQSNDSNCAKGNTYATVHTLVIPTIATNSLCLVILAKQNNKYTQGT